MSRSFHMAAQVPQNKAIIKWLAVPVRINLALRQWSRVSAKRMTIMTHDTPRDETLIDLGEASTTTKGQAIVELDVSGGNLRFLPGIAAE